MSKMYWLVSYPKSGNTWVRSLLSNYTGDSNEAVDINRLSGNPWTNRQLFDSWLGLSSCDLTRQEIQLYRPAFHRYLAHRMPAGSFVKVHDTLTFSEGCEALFPDDITAGVVYLKRDPLDVCISYAHHESQSFDHIIDLMNSDQHWLLPSDHGLQLNLPQYLGQWRSHQSRWQARYGSKMTVISYEQLQQNTAQALGHIVRFLGWHYDVQRIEHATSCSAFERLAAQEQAHPFAQRPAGVTHFFREGISGSGNKRLNLNQKKRLLR